MLANWTKATTATTTNGTITLDAVTGRPLPSKSRTTGEFVQYSIVTSDSKYESGIGKIAASDTLERTKVFSTYDGTTYNSTSATALTLGTGPHDVYITTLAEAIFEPLPFPLTVPSNANVVQTNTTNSQANIGTAAVKRATCYPFRLETSGILTSMSIQVAANGGAGSTTMLGLYEPLSDGKPGRLIAKTSAAIDTSSNGYKTQAVGTNVRLNPGWYWGAICVVTAGTGNPTFTGAAMTSSAFGHTGNLQVLNVRYDADATDLSDPFQTTSLVWVSTGSGIPQIGLILS